MNVPFVDLKAQYLSIKKEMDFSIQQVLDESSFVGGQRVKNFEKEFASLLGVRNCIAVGNGTDAIYITLKMLGIGAGDEVITTALSWISKDNFKDQGGHTGSSVWSHRQHEGN
jgi:dTDP-4-amino-4,6-dideoxygalactose transaminase